MFLPRFEGSSKVALVNGSSYWCSFGALLVRFSRLSKFHGKLGAHHGRHSKGNITWLIPSHSNPTLIADKIGAILGDLLFIRRKDNLQVTQVARTNLKAIKTTIKEGIHTQR